MALPVLNTAKYEVTIPSSGKTVTYRPYLVKEEKVLMIALESNDNKQILRALKDVVNSCVDNINANELTTFDLEYLFLVLRGKSVGENININVKCKECDNHTPYKMTMDKINPPVVNEEIDNKIMLTDDVGITLKYPLLADIESLSVDDNNSDELFDIVGACIDTVFTNDSVHRMADESKAERNKFVGSLSAEQFGMMTKFFENIPAMNASIKWDCIHCKAKNQVELSGLQSFFT